MRRAIRARMLLGLGLAVACVGLFEWSRSSGSRALPEERSTSVEHGQASGTALLESLDLAGARSSGERAPSAGPSTIGGRVRMVDGSQCGSGYVFAWRVGLVPGAADILGALGADGAVAIHVAPIRPDGAFELDGLEPKTRYTLGAAAPGGALAARPSDVRPGRTDIELRLHYLLGLAIVLEDARGEPPRTSSTFFGRGPSATGPAPKLLENPPELAILGIAGLEPGPGSRDRWQYLALSEDASPKLGPIEYRVQVPGYAPVEMVLYTRPVIDRLHEERVVLEALAEGWGELAVELVGAPRMSDLAFPDDELVGAVRLVRAGDDPWELRTIGVAVHARALQAPEALGALPVGDYEAVFEAEDSGYQTEPALIALTRGLHSIAFEVSDAGLLWLDVRDGPLPYDRRCALRIDFVSGGHFYATFDRGPYIVPFLFPGRYHLTELDAPGCAVGVPETVFEIFSGQLTVEIAACDAGSGAESSR